MNLLYFIAHVPKNIFANTSRYSKRFAVISYQWYDRVKLSNNVNTAMLNPIMPDRRRFGHVNVVCVHINTVLVGRREMEEGAVWGGSWNEAVGYEQWTSKDRDSQPYTKSHHSK
jgi:hypothetical protein